jgi:hypothetical protein
MTVEKRKPIKQGKCGKIEPDKTELSISERDKTQQRTKMKHNLVNRKKMTKNLEFNFKKPKKQPVRMKNSRGNIKDIMLSGC